MRAELRNRACRWSRFPVGCVKAGEIVARDHTWRPVFFSGRSNIRFLSPPRGGGCVYARGSSVWLRRGVFLRMQFPTRASRPLRLPVAFIKAREIVGLDPTWRPGVLNGLANAFCSPPRSGGFLCARRKAAFFSSARGLLAREIAYARESPVAIPGVLRRGGGGPKLLRSTPSGDLEFLNGRANLPF